MGLFYTKNINDVLFPILNKGFHCGGGKENVRKIYFWKLREEKGRKGGNNADIKSYIHQTSVTNIIKR